jgi:quinol monooxygenase YgiN
MLIVLARVTVRPDQHQAFAEAARGFIATTRQEAGSIAYDCHRSITDPDVYMFVERWASGAEMEQHLQSPNMAVFMAAAGACVAVPPVVEVIDPASIRTLPTG